MSIRTPSWPYLPSRTRRPWTFSAGLKERGFRMGLISNTAMTPGVTFREFLRQHGMIEFFDVLTFSDELQRCKPGAIPFTSTLAQLDTQRPGRSAHIGDQFVHDILGCQAG